MSYVLHRLPAVANIMLTQEYLEFAQQVMSSHDKANKQAELDVSASMGEMLQDMQACLKQLCGSSSAIQDPEAVARLIAEKVTAMNMSSDSVPKDSGKALALPAPSAKQKVILPDMLADAKRHKASYKHPHYTIPAAASTLLPWPGKSGALALHTGPLLRGCWRSRLTGTCHLASETATSTRRTGIYLSSLSLSLAVEPPLTRLSI